MKLGVLVRAAAVATALVVASLGAAPPRAASAAYTPMYVSSAYNSNYCLRYDAANNVPVLGLCSVSGYSRWLFVIANTTLNTYRLVPDVGVHNMCLEHPSRDSDHMVVSWCDGGLNQTWQISYIGPGNRFTSWGGTYPAGQSPTCLDAPFGGSAVIAARTCHFGTNQQWYNG